MISILPTCRIKGLCPELILGLCVVDGIFQEYGVFVTCGLNGKHATGSLHYDGKAVDIRSHHIPLPEVKQKLALNVRAAIGPDFDFILEDIGEPNEHFHLEFQPKESY